MKNIETQILYGTPVAEEIRKRAQLKAANFQARYGRKPHLAVILSYPNDASQIYVRKKIEACKEAGIQSTIFDTPCYSETELLRQIDALNRDKNIDAFLIQFPLHPSIDQKNITNAVNPTKDVDGFSPYNLGKLVQGDVDGLIPCTPKGVIELLKYYSIPIAGQSIAIIGRSTIVGKPLSLLLSSQSSMGNATVTLLHSQSKNLQETIGQSDIVVAAVGKANLLTGDMIQAGAVIIDVGINRICSVDGKYRLVGDVHFDSMLGKASAITPVPRGIGPMTVACLLENALLCANQHMQK